MKDDVYTYPKVCVLMSTYLGEQWLEKQIESILLQKMVNVVLFIRDDGSYDKTIDVIESQKKKYGERIHYIKGTNIGYKKSFMTLLANAPLNYDYYCFADQDDIWKNEKIIKAIQVIKKNNEPCGYCSKQLYVDENLKSVSGIYQNIDELPVGKYKYQWSIATGLIALGCTFVWNKSLQDIIATNDVSTYNVAHDVFLSIFIPCVGELFKDNKGYLLYRQHNNNTSGNKYRKKYMIDRIIKTIFNKKPDNQNYRVRRIILDEYNNYVNEEAKLMLEDSCKYKGSLKSKAKLLFKYRLNGFNRKEIMKYYYNVLFNRL